MSVKQLSKWVEAEFEVFLVFLRFVIEKKKARAMGNMFAQAIHDAGTLKNKQKFLAYGLQFVDPDLRCNHVVCIALQPCLDGTDAGVAAKLKRVTS